MASRDRLEACAEAAEGSPPVQASGTSSPTIWRTMSAAPSATFGEWETMTMPTLAISCSPRSSQSAAIISEDERAPGSIWPIDRSPRKEARPRVARIGTVASAARAALSLMAAGISARGERRAGGNENVEHRLLAGSLLPRALTALIAAAKAAPPRSARVPAEAPCQRQKQCAVKRTRRAAHLHDELRADGLEEIGQVHARKLVQILQHGLDAPFHIMAVIAVADGGIESGQLVDMRDDAVRDRCDELPLLARVKPQDRLWQVRRLSLRDNHLDMPHAGDNLSPPRARPAAASKAAATATAPGSATPDRSLDAR